jgi:hypothetical protein
MSKKRADSAEMVDVIADYPKIADRLKQQLAEIIENGRTRSR